MLDWLTQDVLGRSDKAKPSSIAVALHVVGTMSGGSEIAASMSGERLQRRNGELVAWAHGEVPPKFDFYTGKGPVARSSNELAGSHQATALFKSVQYSYLRSHIWRSYLSFRRHRGAS